MPRWSPRRQAPAFPAAALAAPRAVGGVPAGRVPVLISPATRDVVGARTALSIGVRMLPVRVTGTVTGIVGTPSGSQFAVLPLWALGKQAPRPTVIAVVGPRLDTAALVRTARRAIPGVQVTLRSHLLTGISGAPLPHGGFVTFAQGIAAVGAFSLLILMLTLVLSARSRELTMARLGTMGLGRPSRGASRRWRPCPRSWPSPWAARRARLPSRRWSGRRWTSPPSPACR